jgi:hypothetical protein
MWRYIRCEHWFLSRLTGTVVGMDIQTHKDRVQQQYDALHFAYDRTVLAMAGGALALSVTFVSQIAPEVVDSWKLGWAWAMLVASLLFIALSYIPSIRAHRRELMSMDHKWLGRIADGLSIGAGLLLALGLGSLAWFAFTNLPKGVVE